MKQPEGLNAGAGQDGSFNEDSTVPGVTPAAYRAPEGSGPSRPQRPLRLPPNTNLEKFEDFIQRIGEIVGTENATIISSDAELQHDDYLDPSKAYDVRLHPTDH